MPGPEEAGPSRPSKRKRKTSFTPPPRRPPPSKRAPASHSRSVTRTPSPDDEEILETADLLPGESPPDDSDGNSEPDDDDDRKLPVRMLTDFHIYEDYEGQRTLQQPDLFDHKDTQLRAVGVVAPYFVNSDASDEDDVFDTTLRLRTTPIRDLYVQYLEYDRLIWIETDFAWYVLCEPSREYRAQYQEFVQRHLSLQLLCSMAADTKATLEDFHNALEREILGRQYRKKDLDDFMNLLSNFARSEGQSILHVPLIRAVRQECGLDGDKLMPQPAPRTRKRRPIIYRDSPRQFNLNKRHEKATPTCMTPFIDRLKRRYHPSWLVDGEVVHWEQDDEDFTGPSPEHIEEERRHLLACVRRARDDDDDTVTVHRTNSHGDVISVHVGTETYAVGDVLVFFPTSSFNGKKPDALPKRDQDIPAGTRLEDLGFWFGKLAHIMRHGKGSRQVLVGHIIWFEHGSRTLVGREGDPRELMLWPRQCDDQPLAAIHGKVGVHMLYESGVIMDLPDSCSYFCRFVYTEGLGYRSLPPSIPRDRPGCSNCDHKHQQLSDDDPTPVGIQVGFKIHGHLYHVNDFCLFYPSQEPGIAGKLGLARIGQIISFRVERDQLELQEYGRIADLVLPPDKIERSWDERQLFVGSAVVIRFEAVVGPCQVLHRDDVVEKTTFRDICSYVAASPVNFWVRYKSESESPDKSSVDDLVELEPMDVPPCPHGCPEKLAERQSNLELFCESKEGRKCLDLCAGTAALSKGLSEGSRGVYITSHAVEIRPSAAQTIRENHPGTKVYATCVNPLLEASVKWHNGNTATYSELKTVDSSLPDAPPQPDDAIDTIVAGIPCQPHSGLNAFKRKKDKKADLMLSFLSWVHFIRPNHIILENVRGFMNFAIDGAPFDSEASRGSGLRFLVNVLMRLGYQVQFSLLNAVHYGAPQRRVRFILFAAKIGVPLMHAPKPTHYHPSEDANLTYSHLNAEGQDVKLSAHEARQYRVPLRYVSVEDAIGDLAPWDLESPDDRVETDFSRDDARLVQLRESLATLCGLPDIEEYPQLSTEEGMVGPQVDRYTHDNSYVGPPRSTFQEAMRPVGKDVHELQHFSLKLGDKMSQLVRLVPLVRRADWRDIADGWVERLSDPTRRTKDWKNGTLGRIDKDDVFQTIVTNVHPLAKQGWVLHPYCRRMLSIRELARAQGIPDWFHIYAPLDDRHRVITRSGVIEMHRLLGNAVPMPLSAAIGWAMLMADFEPWYALPENERWSELFGS
ncbi:S-adenosyl-L-methionine-dependent methyltransferase [Peniophora sp. CONT]|nr:S-adenosyl-L-methionine-dependent methyltransferase [Peniophora sp. CONT]